MSYLQHAKQPAPDADADINQSPFLPAVPNIFRGGLKKYTNNARKSKSKGCNIKNGDNMRSLLGAK